MNGLLWIYLAVAVFAVMTALATESAQCLTRILIKGLFISVQIKVASTGFKKQTRPPHTLSKFSHAENVHCTVSVTMAVQRTH